jgi:hypothetical protein
MPLPNWWRISSKAILLVAVIVARVAAQESPINQRIFREDLHPYGYPPTKLNQFLADYTDLAFLSEDLILVSVKVRAFARSAEPLNTDNPQSPVLLFDLAQKKLRKTSRLPIDLFHGSVRATREGRFLILHCSEIQLCDENLECGPPKAISGDGPLFVSPKGTRILAGGNGQNQQELLDGDSLEVLNHFPFGQATMPGDGVLLFTRGHELCLQRDGFPDERLAFSGGYLSLNAKFLIDSMIAIPENERTLAVVGHNGKTSYRISILPYWSGTDIVPAASGNRFCVHQWAYTVWGSKLSVANEHKTRNVDIYHVFDTLSGAEICRFQWDPRPYFGTTVAPALSPSGHRLAVMRSGNLEVFELP